MTEPGAKTHRGLCPLFDRECAQKKTKKNKESSVQSWLVSLLSPWEQEHQKTNAIRDMHRRTVSAGTMRGFLRRVGGQVSQRSSFPLHLNAHNLRLLHCAEVRILSHWLLFIVSVPRFDLSWMYRVRRRRTPQVEWQENNADRLWFAGAEGKGGKLEIEKGKIGRWKVCTKA